MRTMKGEWVKSWYCPKCHTMFHTPYDEDQVDCPYCDWENVVEKTDRVIVAIPADLPDEFMVRLS